MTTAVAIVILMRAAVEAVPGLLMRAHCSTYCWPRIVRVLSLLDPPACSKGPGVWRPGAVLMCVLVGVLHYLIMTITTTSSSSWRFGHLGPLRSPPEYADPANIVLGVPDSYVNCDPQQRTEHVTTIQPISFNDLVSAARVFVERPQMDNRLFNNSVSTYFI
jgi:hypothetical protein